MCSSGEEPEEENQVLKGDVTLRPGAGKRSRSKTKRLRSNSPGQQKYSRSAAVSI
jgi:hypothetical protein